MSFRREGDPIDVAARAAAAQIRSESAIHELSKTVALPENTTDWDLIFGAEASLIRALPAAELRRRAPIVYNRYADVAGAEKAAQRAVNALDVTNCEIDLLRADLVTVHNETARIYLLGYQVERERGELARFVIYIGFGALALFMTFISWAFVVQLPGTTKRGTGGLAAVVALLIVLGLRWYERRRTRNRRPNATVAGVLFVFTAAVAAPQLLAQTHLASAAATASGVPATVTSSATDAVTSSATTSATPTASTVTSGQSPTPGHEPKGATRGDTQQPVSVPIAPLVILTGVLGACFSVLHRVQRSWAGDPLIALLNLRNARAHIFLSIITGAIASLVVFAVFTGGMISGSLFPTIVNAKLPAGGKGHMLVVYDFLSSTGPATFADYGRLLVWAFIAGFAERFVPDILDRFVASTKKQ